METKFKQRKKKKITKQNIGLRIGPRRERERVREEKERERDCALFEYINKYVIYINWQRDKK